MTPDRPGRTISIVVTAAEFDHLDAVAGRYAMPPAELLRRTAQHIVTLNQSVQIAALPKAYQ